MEWRIKSEYNNSSIHKETYRLAMASNLSLNFGEPLQVQPAAARNPLARRDASLERVVEQMEALRRRPDSPITAIRHQPAREGKFADLPAAVDERLKKVTEHVRKWLFPKAAKKKSGKKTRAAKGRDNKPNSVK